MRARNTWTRLRGPGAGVVVATLLVAVAAGAARAGTGPALVVRSDRAVGGVPLYAGVPQVTKAWGKADHIRQRDRYSCLFTWRKLGVVAEFFSFEGKPCVRGDLLSATITGAGWRTSLGLEIGDPVAAIRKSHPGAARHGLDWWLVTRKVCELGGYAPYAGLLARVRDGCVTGFVFSGSVCD